MDDLFRDWDWEESENPTMKVGDFLLCKKTFTFNNSKYNEGTYYRIDGIYKNWYRIKTSQFRLPPHDEPKIGEYLWDYFEPTLIKDKFKLK